MADSFSDFADAMARPAQASPAPATALDRVAVLGGGADARLLAATCLAEGAEVTLFSAYGRELEALRQGSGIALRGAGPMGSYQVDASSAPSVKTTAELDTAVGAADLIFLTGPVHKQRTYAMVLADHLKDGQVLVLAPSRTFGALETRALLSTGGCTADVTIVELTKLPFWFRAEGSVLHLTNVDGLKLATLPAGRTSAAGGLTRYVETSGAQVDTLRTSFLDASGLVDVPALLLGGTAIAAGGPDIPMGGVPLEENATFFNLIGPDHRSVIHALCEERREVARQFGVRDLPSGEAWIARQAGAAADDGARPVPTREDARAIIRDATVGSLAPLADAARVAGIAAPMHQAMIATASTVLGADLAANGRSLAGIGADTSGVEAARRSLEKLAGRG